MDIGKKIKELRLQKMMTQEDLAGDEITRNMLSRLENGVALPSVPTLIYLADRLNVPAGFLLDESAKNSFIYRKMSNMENVNRAYALKDWRTCYDICRSAFTETDNEIAMILADCCFGIGKDLFFSGKLRSALKYFDRSVEYSKMTVYDTERTMTASSVYISFLSTISPTLYSENTIADEKALKIANSMFDDFCRYYIAHNEILCGNIATAESYLQTFDKESAYARHIQAEIFMHGEEYSRADAVLNAILTGNESIEDALRYMIYCDCEVCCRENEDFRGAYMYSNDKLSLLEKLLED